MEEQVVGVGAADHTDDTESWPGIESLPPSPPTEWTRWYQQPLRS